jgi:2-keto-3-deoxy-6-phosphogluconate aldolase
MRKARRALGGAVLVVVFGVCATVAYGTSDFWFSGNLSSEVAVASTGAHSITYIQGVATSSNFCVAKDTGFAGLGSTTNPTAGTQACATSGGFASRSENGACCYHGWIGNYNNFTINVHPTTRYDY